MSLPIAPPRRGDVWLTNFNPVLGHEQEGVRPAVIISIDSFDAGPSRLVSVAPLTTRDRGAPLHVLISPPQGGLVRPSLILCDHIRSVTHLRLRRRLGAVEPETMRDVELMLRRLLSL